MSAEQIAERNEHREAYCQQIERWCAMAEDQRSEQLWFGPRESEPRLTNEEFANYVLSC